MSSQDNLQSSADTSIDSKIKNKEITAEIEKINEVTLKISINIAQEAFSRSFGKKLVEYSRKIKVNGFRSGKVPVKIVEQLHGTEIRYETVDQLIKNSLNSTFSENNIEAINVSNVEIGKSELGEDLTFTAVVEIYPKPEITGYDSFNVKLEKNEVSDQEIEDQIKLIQKKHATLKLIEDRQVANEGDVAEIDVSLAHGDENPGQSEPTAIVIGEGRLPEQVEKALINLKVGDSVSVEVPHRHADHEHIDKYQIKLNALNEQILPEFNNEFVELLGHQGKSVQEFREIVKESLEQRKKNESEQVIVNGIVEQLLERNVFEVP